MIIEFLFTLVFLGFIVQKLMNGKRGSSVFLGGMGMLFSLTGKILSSFFSLMVFGINRSTYGSAEWLPEWKADFISSYNDGISINGTKFLSKEDSTEHCICVAPSGAGKTTSQIIPTVWNIGRNGSGSIVCTDPSSEIFQRTNNYLRQCGYTVFKIDLTGTETDTFNPLLSNEPPENIAKTLVVAAMGGMGKEPFWNLSCINLLTLLLKLMQCSLPPEERTLGKLKEWVTLVSVPDLRTGIEEMAANNLEMNDFNELLSLFNQPPKLYQSVVAVAKSVMANIDSNAARVTGSHSINLDLLREGKAAIFICVEESKQAAYSYILSLFYMTLMDFAYVMPREARPYNHLFILLDEAANLKLPEGMLSTALTTLRKRCVSIMVIVQSLAQLKAANPYEADNIIGNCKLKLFFSGLDIETCEKVSRTIGMTNYTVRKNAFNFLEKGREMSRRLVQAEELRRLGSDKLLVIFGSENPVKMKLRPYYKNRSIMGDLKG